MQTAFLFREKLGQFLAGLRRVGTLLAPQRRGKEGHHAFSEVEDPQEVVLDYTRTLLPLKKYFLPPQDLLFRFSVAEGYQMAAEGLAEKRIVFGVHSCDLRALQNLDLVFLGGYPDPYYAARRENTLLIGVSCTPDELCFCASVGADSVTEGYDLFLTELEDGYFVEIGSSAGNDLVQEQKELFREVTDEDVAAFKRRFKARHQSFRRHLETSGLPRIMSLEHASSIWASRGEECLGCGGCSMVCPTCYCFSVAEVPNLDGQSGVRYRQWDSCLFKDYSVVAGGHNFRPQRGERLRQRIFHKHKDFPERYGRSGCVGCGRCIAFCPAGLDVTEIIRQLRGEIIA
ncbi:MAG: 4Fe-4S dicluster domain-containing protein [Bacillota bacterium]|nr:4Fe-4S dicluster domain-containing protein [Bacillota bacterium]